MSSSPTTSDDREKYAMAVSQAEALRSLIPRFAASKVFIRATDPVTPLIATELSSDAGIVGSNRDRAVCALANKACNTHAAVRMLTDAGHGDDAMALARVLLENAVILRWLLLDPVYRLDLYCISDALYVRRWGELIQKYFQEKPRLIAKASQEIDAGVLAIAEFFGNTIHKWAQVLHPGGQLQHVNFESMMKEVGADAGDQAAFQYDVIYFLHSGFVHSTASSMRSFRGLEREQHFRCDLGANAQHREEALAGATIFLFQVLQSAATYLGLRDIESDLDAWFEDVKNQLKVNVEEESGLAESPSV